MEAKGLTTIFCIGTIYVIHKWSAWVGPFLFYPDHSCLCISGLARPKYDNIKGPPATRTIYAVIGG